MALREALIGTKEEEDTIAAARVRPATPATGRHGRYRSANTRIPSRLRRGVAAPPKCGTIPVRPGGGGGRRSDPPVVRVGRLLR